jgi:hypothetical protein
LTENGDPALPETGAYDLPCVNNHLNYTINFIAILFSGSAGSPELTIIKAPK